MNKHDSDKERRRQRYLERIGTQHPVCICGGTEWCTFDGHHIADRLFDKHVEFFCANCHRRLSESERFQPPNDQMRKFADSDSGMTQAAAAAGICDHLLGLRCKADDEARPQRLASRDGGEDVGVRARS
jgi:hypothetical protein